MMRVRLFLSAAAAAMLASPAMAQTGPVAGAPAACRLRIDTSASNWIIRGYDPFGNSARTGTFDLTFTNEGEQDCTFLPVFVLDQEAFGLQSGDGRRTPYSLSNLFGNYDATPVAGRSQRRPGQRQVVLAPRGQQVVRVQLEIADEGITGDGLYSQHMQVEAQTADGMAIAGRQLVVGVEVLPSATLGLSGAFRLNNGRASVNLGELNEGVAQVPLQLRVQSTRRYILTLESQHNGRLQLDETDWSVPYQLVVGGQSVELSAGRGEVRAANAVGARRDSLPLQFRIGDVSDRRAGTYSDVISVSIAPE